jgi:hypothetical protein
MKAKGGVLEQQTCLHRRSKRLTHMLAHMKERIAGKIGNANDNAFKLRKLFKMYDATGSGSVSPHNECCPPKSNF